MWEQWETVARSFLPSLSIFGILLLKTSSVTSSSPPFVPISSLSQRPFGTRSLMTWRVLVLNFHTSVTQWESPPPGLASSPSRPSLPAGAQGRTCVCISAYDSNHAPARQGWANVGHLDLSNVVQCVPCTLTSILVFPKTKGSFEKPRLEMFGTNVKLMTFGALSSI